MTPTFIKTLVIVMVCFSVSAIKGFSQEPAGGHLIEDSTMLTSDGVRVYNKKSGTGTPCIFIHGGPGAWSGSFQLLGGYVLEQKLTMYYFDQRGSGRSASAPDGNYSLDRMTEDIENIRQKIGTRQIYLLAHSFGGILACNYAIRYPRHVKGIIMLNATLNVNYSLLNQISFVNEKIGTTFTPSKDEEIFSAYIKAVSALREHGLGYQMLSDRKPNVDKLDSLDNSILRNNAFGKVAFTMSEYFSDFTPATSMVDAPVLVISGTKDHNIGPDHYKQFHFPNQQVRLIQGGHMLYFEQNKDFKDAVFEFIK